MNEAGAADFAHIAMALHGADGVGATLDRIAELARATVDCDMCGVMVVHKGKRVETAAVTSELVRRADELQIEVGEGPCLQAIEAQLVFIIADTMTEDRWPVWSRAVVDLGVRCVLSIRLFTRQQTIGSLNLYSAQPNHFTPADAAIGGIFAGHASVALAAAQTESGLREAMESRHLIGLAQGILMERFDLDQEQAFAVLRRYSQDRNIKLRSVAQHVVQERALPE